MAGALRSPGRLGFARRRRQHAGSLSAPICHGSAQRVSCIWRRNPQLARFIRYSDRSINYRLDQGLTPEAVLPILLNNLDRLDEDFVLVLDDYHHIADSSVHQLLWGLLAHPPRPLQLVLTARHDPPIPPRIRVQGAVTELRARDLSFTAAETAEFLRQFVAAAAGCAVHLRIGAAI